MNITDNNDHCIKPKKYHDYDYIINVHGKTSSDIIDEILDA